MKPNARIGLHERSGIMVDKITTVSKPKLGGRIGRLVDLAGPRYAADDVIQPPP